MYIKRIRITDYGPFGDLDLSFPFEENIPRPVVLVGGNGSGKSILLSHIVNGLILAKDRVYQDSPEVNTQQGL